MKASGEVARIDGVDVQLTHRDKIEYPQDGYTKGDVTAYYAGVAKRMVPLVQGHPLMFQRFPNGIEGPGFIQQEVSDYFPKWIDRATVAKKGGRIAHVLANKAATLVYLANQGAITLHMWQSRADKPDFPDRMVFDLDPAGDDFRSASSAAQAFHTLLDQLKLPSFVMTTGSRGLHVIVPLDRSERFEPVREFARQIGGWMAAQWPDRLTTEVRIAKRGERLFLDAMRNAYAHTAVAPYSLRPKNGAPIATPIAWDELKDKKMNARRFTLANIFERLKEPDPWKDLKRRETSLKEARNRFARIAGADIKPARPRKRG